MENNNDIPRIKCEELQEMLEKDEKVVIIDTRATVGYKDDHINGAINTGFCASIYFLFFKGGN